MYSRIHIPVAQSFFLFGPRGTGKSTYLKKNYPHSPLIDLLDDETYTTLLAQPKKISQYIPEKFQGFVIIDEIQKLPKLLDEVHRLMENKRFKFILTGSSARKLKKSGVNLLGGRALTAHMYPLTALELKDDFSLYHSLQHGQLPLAYTSDEPKKYLASYVRTYLEEEIKQEGYTRNLSAFTRFLEAASFSQASVLNVAKVATECEVERKVVVNYFSILEDLLLAYQIPVFTRRAKRRMLTHSKFYFFDVGVFQSIRPKGPLDGMENAEGAALETLVLQELMAINERFETGYKIYYWRTSHHVEVDFVLYGEKGLIGIEVKSSRKFSSKDLKGLNAFGQDYPMARRYLIYGGDQKRYQGKIVILPLLEFFKKCSSILGGTQKP